MHLYCPLITFMAPGWPVSCSFRNFISDILMLHFIHCIPLLLSSLGQNFIVLSSVCCSRFFVKVLILTHDKIKCQLRALILKGNPFFVVSADRLLNKIINERIHHSDIWMNEWSNGPFPIAKILFVLQTFSVAPPLSLLDVCSPKEPRIDRALWHLRTIFLAIFSALFAFLLETTFLAFRDSCLDVQPDHNYSNEASPFRVLGISRKSRVGDIGRFVEPNYRCDFDATNS